MFTRSFVEAADRFLQDCARINDPFLQSQAVRAAFGTIVGRAPGANISGTIIGRGSEPRAGIGVANPGNSFVKRFVAIVKLHFAD